MLASYPPSGAGSAEAIWPGASGGGFDSRRLEYEEARLALGTKSILAQANTSKSNVFLRSSAQSTRGVLSFCGSLLASRSHPPLLLEGLQRHD